MKPQTTRVLKLLEDNPRGVTTRDFMLADGVSHKFASRISELRAKGYVIKTKPVRRGAYLYKLISGPPATSGSTAARDSSAVDSPPHDDDQAADSPISAASGRTTAVEPEPAGSLFDLDEARPKNAALEDYDDEASAA